MAGALHGERHGAGARSEDRRTNVAGIERLRDHGRKLIDIGCPGRTDRVVAVVARESHGTAKAGAQRGCHCAPRSEGSQLIASVPHLL